MNMKYIFANLVVILLLLSTPAFSTMEKNQVFLSGYVTDINSGQPVKCDIKIDNGNNSFKIFSDPISGKYQQLIKAKQDYIFTLYMWNIYRTQIKISYPASDDYREETRDFKVIILKPGVAVENQNIFTEGNNISPEGEKFLKGFKKTMRFHRTVKWNLYVNTKDNAKIQLVKDYITSKYKAYAKKINIKAIDSSVKNAGNNDVIITVDTITEPKY